jgi:hypothetical protein
MNLTQAQLMRLIHLMNIAESSSPHVTQLHMVYDSPKIE